MSENIVKSSKYKIGDEVYLLQRYPDKSKKPFVKRTITNVLLDDNGNYSYVLDDCVQVGKDYFVGHYKIETFEDEILGSSSNYAPAKDLHFSKMGEYESINNVFLTLETIDNDI